MKFNWRYLEQGDYGMLKTWWEDWGWTPPPIDALPVGFLVYVQETGVPVYAGFLYETGTTIGWMEFIVSNKNASVSDRRGGLDYLIQLISTIAKSRGIKTLYSSVSNKGLMKNMTNNGFDITDKNMTNLIKIL